MRNTVQLSDEQAAGVEKMIEWFTKSKRQMFTIAGYAGTGKSTLLNEAIRALRLHKEEVAYVAYTGKASLVLINKGIPAQTIHRLCYEPLLSSYKDPLTFIKKTKVSGFRLKAAIPDIQLIVVDEVSMVGEDLLRALKSFNIKILALGDPGQLAPVKSKASSLLLTPDVFLQKIHRQAEGNPILWAAQRARQGLPIPLGNHGALRVIKEADLDFQDVLQADQLITCTHAYRQHFNKEVRTYYGYEDHKLPQLGEKLINLHNRWEDISSESMTPLVNGLPVEVVQEADMILKENRTFRISVNILGSTSDRYYDLKCNLAYFDPLRGEKVDTEGNMVHLDFGYAITCHRSQGSEYTQGVGIMDTWGGDKNKAQLLYTTLTRFAERVTLVQPDWKISKKVF